MRLGIAVLLGLALVIVAVPVPAAEDTAAEAGTIELEKDAVNLLPVARESRPGSANMLRVLLRLLEFAGDRISGANDLSNSSTVVDGEAIDFSREVIRQDDAEIVEVGDVSVNFNIELSFGDITVAEEIIEIAGMGSALPAMAIPPGPPEHARGVHPPEMPLLDMLHEHHPELRPELLELLMHIPPEVDPGFMEFIMHVGELAWQHPEFRERLELLVHEAHEHLDR